MGSLLISLLTLVLLLISAYIVLIVLMQRTSQSGGMGAALGGGAAESAFGSETNSILMKGTIYGIVAFFVVALSLYLLYQSAAADRVQEVDMDMVIQAGAAGAQDDSADVNLLPESADQGGTDEASTGSDALDAQTSDAIESGISDAPPVTN